MGRKTEWVTASEIGSYVYCSRQFWLSKVKKVRPPKGRGRDRLKKGTKNHHRHGVRYDWQLRLRRAGFWLAGIAALILALLFLVAGGLG